MSTLESLNPSQIITGGIVLTLAHFSKQLYIEIMTGSDLINLLKILHRDERRT